MAAEHALAFLAFSFAAAITPGPSNIMLTATGAVVGIARGLPCLLGVGAGMGLMIFVVAFGLGGIVLAHPPLVTVSKVSGTAFLLWLSWKIARAAPSDTSSNYRPLGFVGAFAFQWLNLKSWLVSTSAIATYLDAEATALIQALWMACLFASAALPSGLLWLSFGVAIRRLLKKSKNQRIFNASMGAMLACSVLVFLW